MRYDPFALQEYLIRMRLKHVTYWSDQVNLIEVIIKNRSKKCAKREHYYLLIIKFNHDKLK